MQNFSRPVQGNIFKLGVKSLEKVGNLMENWPYLENGERYDQLITNRKWHTPYQMR